MLTLFLFHIIISFFCLSAGFVFYRAIYRTADHDPVQRPMIIYLITGLIILIMIAQAIALLAPVGIYAQAILFSLVLVSLTVYKRSYASYISALFKKMKEQNWTGWVALCMLWILILFINAGPTMMDDTESYHIQMVKWIKEYGSVPGLVHLHERYGFNSSWFSGIALFSVEKGHLNYYTVLNGTLSLWLAIYLITRAHSRLKTATIFSFAASIVLLIMLTAWPLIKGNAATANYDYITLLIVFILFTETFRLWNNGKDFTLSTEYIIWPAFLFTVRIMNFPVLLLLLFSAYYLWKGKKRNLLIIHLSVSALLIIPFIIRNVILSGYPFYPSMAFNFFPVDWKADTQTTESLLAYIKYFNRINTGFVPIEITASMGFSQWVPAWFKYMFTYDKIVFLPGMLGIFSFSFFSRLWGKRASTPLRIFFLAIGLQVITWFMIAPDPRFIYGPLLCGILFLVLIFCNLLKKINLYRIISPVMPYFVVAAVGVSLLKWKRASLPADFITPVSLPVPGQQVTVIDGINLYTPAIILNNWNPRCYDTRLPCVYKIDPRTRARGRSIRQGFRLDK